MPVSSNNAPTPFRRITRFVAVAAWCALIYAASDRPDLRVSGDDLLDLVLRKAAHVAVFGVLLVLVHRALDRRSLTAAWLATLAYAISDEWHQTFVPGRAGQPSDVAIDMVGASIAATVLLMRDRRHRALEVTP